MSSTLLPPAVTEPPSAAIFLPAFQLISPSCWKFPPLSAKPHKPDGEFDVDFKEFPFGLEFENPPAGQKGAFVWKVEKGSFEATTANILRGDMLIGIDGQNVARTTWSIAQHAVANAEYPCTLRFRRPKFPKFQKDVKKLPFVPILV